MLKHPIFMCPVQRVCFRILANTSVIYNHTSGSGSTNQSHVDSLLRKAPKHSKSSFGNKYIRPDWVKNLYSQGNHSLLKVFRHRTSGSIGKHRKYQSHALSFLKYSRNVCMHIDKVFMKLYRDSFNSR